MENKITYWLCRILTDLKERIRKNPDQSCLSANRELILLYLEIGRMILERQRKEGWLKGD